MSRCVTLPSRTCLTGTRRCLPLRRSAQRARTVPSTRNDLSNPNVVPDTELSGFAVIDSGATETVASLPALEALMGLRAEPVIATDAPAKRFKFGSGEHAFSSSYILLPQTVGDQAVQLGVFTMDVTGVPLLLGIKSLRRLQAVLDFDRSVAVFAAVDPGLAIHLKRSRSGHMLIDLKGDWLAEGTRLDSLPQQISTPCSAEENYVETAFVIEGALGEVPDNVQDPCQSDEHVPVSESRVLSAHVRAEPRSPEPDCSPSSCKDMLMPVLKSDGPRDSMKPLGAFLTLVAQHGFRNLAYSERMSRSTTYDGLRDQRVEPKEAGHGSSFGRSQVRRVPIPETLVAMDPLAMELTSQILLERGHFRARINTAAGQPPTPTHPPTSYTPRAGGACSLSQGGTFEQRCQGGPSGDPGGCESRGLSSGSGDRPVGGGGVSSQPAGEDPSSSQGSCPEGKDQGCSKNDDAGTFPVRRVGSAVTGNDPDQRHPDTRASWTEGHPDQREDGGGSGVRDTVNENDDLAYHVTFENNEEIEALAKILLRDGKYDFETAERFLTCLVPRRWAKTRATMAGTSPESYAVTFGLFAHGNMAGITRATFLCPWTCHVLECVHETVATGLQDYLDLFFIVASH